MCITIISVSKKINYVNYDNFCQCQWIIMPIMRISVNVNE